MLENYWVIFFEINISYLYMYASLDTIIYNGNILLDTVYFLLIFFSYC